MRDLEEMPMEGIPYKPKIERRREILYGTPGIVIYRDGRPVLWVPDNIGSITRNLSYKDLEALQKELKKYLQSTSPDGRGEQP
jgi:hypothetical protein